MEKEELEELELQFRENLVNLFKQGLIATEEYSYLMKLSILIKERIKKNEIVH